MIKLDTEEPSEDQEGRKKRGIEDVEAQSSSEDEEEARYVAENIHIA